MYYVRDTAANGLDTVFDCDTVTGGSDTVPESAQRHV